MWEKCFSNKRLKIAESAGSDIITLEWTIITEKPDINERSWVIETNIVVLNVWSENERCSWSHRIE